MPTINEIVNNYREEIKAKIEEVNKAIATDKSSTEVSDLLTELITLEKKFEDNRRAQVYEELSKTPAPLFEAIKLWSFSIITHKPQTNDDGQIVRYNMVDEGAKNPKQSVIDFVDFCKSTGLDTEWYEKVQNFNKVLTLREAERIGKSQKAIQGISDSYTFDGKIKTSDEPIPTSNTQLLKRLQECIDAMVFVDAGKGSNKFKANSHDVNALTDSYTKLRHVVKSGKAVVSMPSHKGLVTSIATILYKIISEGDYTVRLVKYTNKD